MAGIYLHIPFCKKACHYCDFHFSTSLKHQQNVLDAMAKEIKIRKSEMANHLIESIYFGGGTPSLLSAREITQIIDLLYKNFKIDSLCEITLEANPDDLSLIKIQELSKTKINRLSIGVQSFFDEDLRYMNRSHNSNQAINCIKHCKKYFKNMTIDLIYGIPTMSVSRWVQNLKRAFSLPIKHLSCYALTVEEKTPLARFIQQKKTDPMDENKALSHFKALQKNASLNGFSGYETSNFAKMGYYSKHNTGYWLGKPYLGIGPSAHSFDGIKRSWNVSSNVQYYQSISRDKRIYTQEVLTIKDRYNEYLMTSLRTIWGVSLNKIKMDFGKKYSDYLTLNSEHFIEEKLLTIDNGYLKHTPKSAFLIDGIIADLFYV